LSFYRTYEELKHLGLSVNKKTFNKFLSYLWGIETAIRHKTPSGWWYERFYRTYEELKLSTASWAARPISFLSYLWGIETRQFLHLNAFQHPVFIVPMRIETQRFSTPNLTNSAFLSYLWGIETASRIGQIKFYLYPFLSYLWGIETKRFICAKTVFCCFIVLWGIETFHITSPTLKMCMSFYRTYEELKLFSGSSFSFWALLVFIVPMRNWNDTQPSSSPTNQRGCFYRTYEELKQTDIGGHLYFSSVFIVPMRNWNLLPSLTPVSTWVVFIVPMRNWNLAIVYNTINWGKMFLSYLWGIETIKIH